MSKTTMSVEDAIRELIAENPDSIYWDEDEDGPLDDAISNGETILDLDASEVISFIQSNYTEITGNPERDMYAEQEFDWEVTEIAKMCGVSYDTLCEYW